MRPLPLLATVPGLLLAGCATPPQPMTGDTLTLTLGLVAALALNSALTLLVVWAWQARRAQGRSRRGLIRELERELRHLRHWAGAEGALRKAGLLRELDALGATFPDLTGYELAGADLAGLDLSDATLRGANLAGANLQGCSLRNSDLFGTALAEANLALADLRGAHLRGAELEHARLVKADLRGANLQRANLVDADLQGARLDGANLELARFAPPLDAPGQHRLLEAACHPSVEDWIRARLDAEGRYRAENDEAEAPGTEGVEQGGGAGSGT